MKVVIEIPEKMYQKIIAGTYDYGDMNVIIRNGTQYDGRPHGEWKQVCEMTYKCTNCGWLKKTSLMPYCENCGSDNREK